MEKRLYPIVLLTVLLALLAAAGYILDNKGGKIVFEHKAHAEGYGLECSSCHHAENLDKGISPCGECHNAETAEFGLLNRMEAFHQSCMGCHEEVGSGPYGKDQCNQCHLK